MCCIAILKKIELIKKKKKKKQQQQQQQQRDLQGNRI